MNKSGTKTFSREQKRNCTKANLKLYDTSSNNVSEVRIKVALSTKYSHLGYKKLTKEPNENRRLGRKLKGIGRSLIEPRNILLASRGYKICLVELK